MSYRVAKIEPCPLRQSSGVTPAMACKIRASCCDGCQGDGTRTVDVCEIERAPDWWWSPTEQAATAGTWGHGDDRAVWVEVKP